MMKLYENIKRLRKEHGLTQDELARKAGYTDRSSIAKIERGSVDLSQSKIKQFADIFGVTPGDLMGWEDEEEQQKTATIDDSGMSETKQKLLDLARNCTDEEAAKLLQLMELFLGKQ